MSQWGLEAFYLKVRLLMDATANSTYLVYPPSEGPDSIRRNTTGDVNTDFKV